MELFITDYHVHTCTNSLKLSYLLSPVYIYNLITSFAISNYRYAFPEWGYEEFKKAVKDLPPQVHRMWQGINPKKEKLMPVMPSLALPAFSSPACSVDPRDTSFVVLRNGTILKKVAFLERNRNRAENSDAPYWYDIRNSTLKYDTTIDQYILNLGTLTNDVKHEILAEIKQVKKFTFAMILEKCYSSDKTTGEATR